MSETLHSKEESSMDSLLEKLEDDNAHIRHLAREELVALGESAITPLVSALRSHNWRIRWEAAKALGEIGNPDVAPVLVTVLEDEDTGVRWAAMGSLIRLGRASIRALLQELTRDFASARLREGAYHVLHELKMRGELTDAEMSVLAALKSAEPSVAVPWAANECLKKEWE